MPNLFPYTNTHELNLDWILQVVKDFQTKYTTFDQALADALAAIQAGKTEALDEISTDLTAALNDIEASQTAALTAIGNTKDSALADIGTALTNATNAISALNTTVQAEITTLKNTSISEITTAQGTAISAITASQNHATTIIEQLYNTLPASAQDILGKLDLLDNIITGNTMESFTWLQGAYVYPEGVTPPTPPAINTESPTYNQLVSSRYMTGVGGRRIRIITDGTIYMTSILTWRNTPPGGGAGGYVPGQASWFTNTYADILLPLNVTAFSIEISKPNTTDTIAPTDIPGHIEIQWITDFVSQRIIAPKESSTTADVAREEGEFFFLDGDLYESTDDIAVGDTIAEGTNCKAVTVGEEVSELKSAVNNVYDDGDIMVISNDNFLHPTGDGTVTLDATNMGFTYTEVSNQGNGFGFTLETVAGVTYTITGEITDNIVSVYFVDGTTFSSSKALGKVEMVTGKFSFTGTALSTITTVWFSIDASQNSAAVTNIKCCGLWAYKNLDEQLESERFPAQGKAVGAMKAIVDDNAYKVNRMYDIVNYCTVNAQNTLHTSGDSIISYTDDNGFTSNNSGHTNNLIGIKVKTQSHETYVLSFDISIGEIYEMKLIHGEVYNAGIAIHTWTNASGHIEYEFEASTEVTTIWFTQRYNMPLITVNNFMSVDGILRYKKYIMDYDGTEFDVFNKVLCVGDSLTEGTFNYESGGSTNNVIADSRYSYPTYLAKLSGSDIVNKGHGGYTAAQWYARYQNETLSGYDCAIIMLGINDSFQDVNISDFRQAMTNIINKLMTENNGIKIFVATLIPAYTDYNSRFDDYNNEIKRLVAEDFTDAKLVDINEYSICKYYTYYAQGHLTAIGYQQLAKEFYTLISFIIHNDLEAFRNVQFIGTNYTYPDPTT